jgi:hypothetical protein
MVVAGQCVADEHRVVAGSVQRAIGLEHEGIALKHRAAVERERGVEVE